MAAHRVQPTLSPSEGRGCTALRAARPAPLPVRTSSGRAGAFVGAARWSRPTYVVRRGACCSRRAAPRASAVAGVVAVRPRATAAITAALAAAALAVPDPRFRAPASAVAALLAAMQGSLAARSAFGSPKKPPPSEPPESEEESTVSSFRAAVAAATLSARLTARAATRERDNLQDALAALEARIAEVAADADGARAARAAAEQDARERAAAEDAARVARAEAQRDAAREAARADSAERARDVLQARVDDLLAALEDARTTAAQSREDVAAARRQEAATREDIVRMARSLERSDIVRDELERARLRVADLERDLRDKSSEVTSLKEDLSKVREELSAAHAVRQELSSQVERFMGANRQLRSPRGILSGLNKIAEGMATSESEVEDGNWREDVSDRRRQPETRGPGDASGYADYDLRPPQLSEPRLGSAARARGGSRTVAPGPLTTTGTSSSSETPGPFSWPSSALSFTDSSQSPSGSELGIPDDGGYGVGDDRDVPVRSEPLTRVPGKTGGGTSVAEITGSSVASKAENGLFSFSRSEFSSEKTVDSSVKNFANDMPASESVDVKKLDDSRPSTPVPMTGSDLSGSVADATPVSSPKKVVLHRVQGFPKQRTNSTGTSEDVPSETSSSAVSDSQPAVEVELKTSTGAEATGSVGIPVEGPSEVRSTVEDDKVTGKAEQLPGAPAGVSTEASGKGGDRTDGTSVASSAPPPLGDVSAAVGCKPQETDRVPGTVETKLAGVSTVVDGVQGGEATAPHGVGTGPTPGEDVPQKASDSGGSAETQSPGLRDLKTVGQGASGMSRDQPTAKGEVSEGDLERRGVKLAASTISTIESSEDDGLDRVDGGKIATSDSLQTEGMSSGSLEGATTAEVDTPNSPIEPSPEVLLAEAKDIVASARRKAMNVQESDALYTSAVGKIRLALDATNGSQEALAQYGATLLKWAKCDLNGGSALDRLEEASRSLALALEKNPVDEGSLFNRGLCICLMAASHAAGNGKELYTEACRMYDKLLEIHPGSRVGAFNCGLAYVSRARLAEADDCETDEIIRLYQEGENRFRTALESRPTDDRAKSYLSECENALRKLRSRRSASAGF